MSTAEGITVVIPPEPAEDMQRDDEVLAGTHVLAPGPDEVQRGPRRPWHTSVGSRTRRAHSSRDRHLDDLPSPLGDERRRKDFSSMEETCARCLSSCARCLSSCVFFFFCHALGELFLKIICVSSCLPCLGVKTPPRLEPQNRTEKLFAFLAKNLSKLWVTALLVLYIQWMLFQPIDVKPYLGTSAIHAFDLQRADAMVGTPGAPRLRFNLTAYLLFKNTHKRYHINYDNLAVSVLYAGEKLGPVDFDELPSFKQDPHGSTVMRLVFVGHLRNASSTVVEMFSGDRDKGLFQMLVRIRVTLAYKSWPFKDQYFTMYDCPLSSPFPQTGEPALSSPARCKINDI